MLGYMVPPASRNEIKQLANKIRRACGLHNIKYFPVMEFIEIILPTMDSSFNYQIVDDMEIGSDQANYNPANNTMKIRNSVYEGACNGNGRDRFTIAHEVGHYWMHSDIVLSRTSNSIKKIPAYRNSEWQANTFAAALLMPDHIIINMSPEDISEKCGTSHRAAFIAYDKLLKEKTTKFRT